MSMKPKVALVKDGFLPAGSENKRGRLSLAADARLKELAGMGWQIDGYSVSKSTTPDTAPVVTKAASADPNRVVDVPDESRPESLWIAYRHADGKPVDVGMRTCCNVCRASLTYCRCESPRVWVDFDSEAVVYFKPRPESKALPNKRW